MPLVQGKSKEAFQSNVKAEIDSGKPRDQALAIAYNIRKKNLQKAEGGMVESSSDRKEMIKKIIEKKAPRYAKGGRIPDDYEPKDDDIDDYLKGYDEEADILADHLEEEEAPKRDTKSLLQKIFSK